MIVAYIIGSYPAISETFILNEMLALQDKGIEISVFAFNKSQDAITHLRTGEIKKVFYFPKINLIKAIYGHIYWFFLGPMKYLKCMFHVLFTKNYMPKSRLSELLYYAILVSRINPNHVHAHFGRRTADLAMLINQLTGLPFTFTTHGSDIFVDPPTNYFIKSKKAKKHITVSEFTKNYVIDKFGVKPGWISVVHSAVDFNRLKNYPIHDGGNIIICIARLIRSKGLDILIKACATLKSNKIDFRCFIVGEGRERENLELLINTLKLNDTVILLGIKTQEEVFELLAGAKIKVLASRSEGIPNVLKEAMALKVPVIATDVSGVPELVENGISGFLVPPENAKLLADKIEILLADSDLRRSFGERGYEKVFREFNLEKEINKLFKIWELVTHETYEG